MNENEKVLWQGKYYFRKLEILNVPCVRGLYFQEEGIDMNTMQVRHYEARARKVYAEMLSRGSYIYGCFDDETKLLVGAITVNKCLDLYPNYVDKPYIHLETFIVHKEYQNQGIGTQLLIKVLEVIKEEGCTYVIMQSANPAVQHMSKKVGLNDSLADMRIDFVDK